MQETAEQTQEVMEQTSISEVKVEINELLSFSIEPINDIADFHFFIDGKEVKGSTSGKLEVNKEGKKRQEESEKKKEVSQKQSAISERKTKSSEKRTTKSKNTERKAIEWYWWIFIGVVGWELCKWAFKMTVKRFWPTIIHS